MSEVETQAPIVVNSPVEVEEGIYVIPDGRVPLVPNIGIAVGSGSALVVDTGMGPENGSAVRRHAERLADGRALFLTLTHFHPEHGYGAQAFRPGATIVYNREQRDELLRKGAGYLEMFRGFGEGVARQLEGVALVEPDVVYDGAGEVALGGLTAELRTWGLAHTGGDQVVFMREPRVLFTGDLVESRCFAIFPWFPPDDIHVDGHLWITVLEELERLEPAIVVPGHGEIGGVDIVATAREYLQQLRDQTRELAIDGVSEEDAAAEIDRRMRALHPDWDQPEWIPFGVRSFYAAHARGR